MNNSLDDNFADYFPPGRGPLRYERRRAREELQARGVDLRLEPNPARGIGGILGDIESWWAELTPEQRVGEAIGNLWQPEMAMGGVLAKGGQRFYSYLTKVLEEVVGKRAALRQGPEKVPEVLSKFVRPKGEAGPFIDLRGRSVGYKGLDAHGNTLDAIAEHAGVLNRYPDEGGAERFDIQRDMKLIYSVWGGDLPHTYAARPEIGSYDEVKNAVLKNMEDIGVKRAVLEYGNKKEVVDLVGREEFPPNLVGEQVLRRLQKLGVSKDELKYTGVADWLRERGRKPVDTEELLEFARANELKMKVRELAYSEDYQKAELMDRMREARENLMKHYRKLRPDVQEYVRRVWNQPEPTTSIEPPEDIKRAIAARRGYNNLLIKETNLSQQHPSHQPSYYGSYTLPSKTGFPPGYRERLYEPNKPEGVEVEFTHRPNYPRAFAHSRSRDLEVRLPEGEVIPSRHVEELQTDTHQRVAGYLTGDPMKDASLITKTMTDTIREEKTAFEYDWKFDNAYAHLYVGPDPTSGGFKIRLAGEGRFGGDIEDEMTFKSAKGIEDNLIKFVQRHRLNPDEMLENFKGRLTEGDVRLAADYPFKEDWWKVQMKDQLMEAARDPNVKALSFSGREVMSERVGYDILPKDTILEWEPRGPNAYSQEPYGRVRIHRPQLRNQGFNKTYQEKLDKYFASDYGEDLLREVKEKGTIVLKEDFVQRHGKFADELYEKKVPTWIEEEFGVKPVKGRALVRGRDTAHEFDMEAVEKGGAYGPEYDQQGFGMPIRGSIAGDVPVWVIPIDEALRKRLRKPQRLSWLSQQEMEGLA